MWAETWIDCDWKDAGVLAPWELTATDMGKPNRSHWLGSVLLYNRGLLDQEGFIAVRFLSQLHRSTGEVYGIYGPPKDFGNMRGHLVLPIVKAMQAELKIYDWGVIEWQDQKTKSQVTI